MQIFELAFCSKGCSGGMQHTALFKQHVSTAAWGRYDSVSSEMHTQSVLVAVHLMRVHETSTESGPSGDCEF